MYLHGAPPFHCRQIAHVTTDGGGIADAIRIRGILSENVTGPSCVIRMRQLEMNVYSYSLDSIGSCPSRAGAGSGWSGQGDCIPGCRRAERPRSVLPGAPAVMRSDGPFDQIDRREAAYRSASAGGCSNAQSFDDW